MKLLFCLIHLVWVSLTWFYAFNIIAGGILSGKHKFDGEIQKGRFSGQQGASYRGRYWQNSKFEAVNIIQNAIKKYNDQYNDKLTILEASLRWIMHHSWLDENDGVILGVSSFKHYVDNLKSLQCKKELPLEIVKAFDIAWNVCSKDCVSYIGSHHEPWNDLRCKL